MTITVEVIDHESQRYETTGDWIYNKETEELTIYISKVNNWKSEMAVAVHEILEALLCIDRGIDQEVVDYFDTTHPELEDPGLSSDAPYHREHIFATSIEMLLTGELKVNWNDHNELLEELYKID